MGRVYLIYLEGNLYGCKHCQAHLGLAKDIISKSFHCRHGKVYLFDKVVNVTVGEKEDRMMMTGMHTVVDIFCVGCGSIVGWKYEAAQDKNQKYKEGKFILERFKVLGPSMCSLKKFIWLVVMPIFRSQFLEFVHPLFPFVELDNQFYHLYSLIKYASGD